MKGVEARNIYLTRHRAILLHPQDKTRLIFPRRQREAMFDFHISSKILQRDSISFHIIRLSPWLFERKLFQGSRSNYSVPAKDISRSRWTRKKNSMSVIFRTDLIMGTLITETVIKTKTKKRKKNWNLTRT